MFKRNGAVNVFDQVARNDTTDRVTATLPAMDDATREAGIDEVELQSCEVDQRAADDEEAEPDTGGEEDAGQDAPARSHRLQLLRWGAGGTVATLFVATLAAAGWLGWQVKQRDDVVAAGQAALDAARSYAVTLTSVDSKDIDRNFTQVLDGATGEFKDMYSQSASQLRQVLIDNKAVSNGVVVDSAIKSASTTKVEVLLFIDQSISNAVVPGPRIDRNRVAITMEFVDGHWLASKVDIK